MKPIIYLTTLVFFTVFSNTVLALDESSGSSPITIDSAKGAKINIYCYESTSASLKEKPVLLVHGFNSNGTIWQSKDENKNYVKNLRDKGYDVIVVDMRGNPVDTNGDHIIDTPVVGNSWGYGVNDLGDDVGIALKEGMDYLNKNLPDRNYKKSDVITHSTGALAVTAYSRSLGLVPYRNDIETVIELAPPNKGSTSLVANIKNILGVIPSVFTQSMTAYQYALEVADNKIWIPGSRMESEALRKELSPDSMFLKSIQDLGPDKRIKTFIAIGSEDWVVGDWSPVIGKRDDIGYEYFLGVDHFNFCNSQTVIAVILDKLEKGGGSGFFSRFKPYKNKQLAFLSGPGIDHPDDTFDTVDFAKGIDISPAKLFDLYLRIAARKNKSFLLRYWEILSCFQEAQIEISEGGDIDNIMDKWEEALGEKNKLMHDYYGYASREYLETPDIAVLANGYHNEMRKLVIEKVNEPVRIVDHTFAPYILDEQRILIIPTGGLSGLSHSAIFKNKLSEYVKNGGTVICFSQQYGYDFNALPGGRLSAYGWQEDISCYAKAAYIENFHQILSSQTDLYPDMKLDGYFTDYPDGAKILLMRTKNQMPALLMYNFGKGMVIAGSMYPDWGYLNGQAGSSEIDLVRDLLRWAKSGKDLPEYKTGETFENPIQTSIDFDKIEMILKSAEGKIMEKVISNEAVYKSSLALKKPGIYSVDYILYDADSKVIQPQAEGFYFSFAEPPPSISDNPDFTFDITSDNESYVSGNEAIFTFHIKNNTAKDEIIRCKARLPHHKIDFNDTVTVPANKAIAFDKKITAVSIDRLSAYFYSSQNILVGKAERGISIFEPSIDISVTTDKQEYLPGETVSMAIGLKNKASFSLDILAILDIIDPNNDQIYYNSSTIVLTELGSSTWFQDFIIPENVTRGALKARVSAFSNSKQAGFKSAGIEVPKPLIYVVEDMPDALIAGAQNEIKFYLENPLDMASMPGEFSLRLVSPGGAIVWQEKKDFESIGPHKEKPLGFILQLPSDFIGGRYKFIYTLSHNGEEKEAEMDLPFKTYIVSGADMDLTINMENSYPRNQLISASVKINNKGDNIAKSYIDIRVFPAIQKGDLYGVIKDNNGIAVKGAVINGIHTNEYGRYRIKGINKGRYPVNIKAPGFDSVSEDVEILSGNNNLDISLTASRYGNLSGVIENSIGSVVTLGPVNVRGSDASIRFAVTAPDGLFKFKYLPVGDYLLAVSPGGISKNIQISEGENVSNDTVSPSIYQDLQEAEPNYDFSKANEAGLNSRIHGRIYDAGDEDFFKFNIQEKGILYIKMYELPQALRPSIKIYNPINNNVIAMEGGVGGQKISLNIEFDKPGLYYLLVRDWYGNMSSLDGYSMNFNFIRNTDEYEPNDSIETARLIDFGRNYFATIAVKADSDFYKLSVPDSGKVIICLKDAPVNIRPHIELHRSAGPAIYIIGGEAGEDVTMEFETANPSNYYVHIHDRYGNESSFLRYRFLAAYIPEDEYPESDFSCFQKEEKISNLAGEKEVDFKIPGLEDYGKYTLQAVLKSSTLQELAGIRKTFYIGDDIDAVSFEIQCLENDTLSFNAGEKAKFRFKVINKGGVKGECGVDFKYQDLIDEAQSVFLESGEGKEITFEFLIPEDADEGGHEAEYIFKGESRKIGFTITGIKVEAGAGVEAGIFKLKVKNLTSVTGLKLFAEVRCPDYEKKIDFVLNKEKDLEFGIPGLDKKEKVYYGIYFESGKSLYLDSYLIIGEKREAPLIKIIKAGCDKDIYEDGEDVILDWKIESGEACAVTLSVDLIKPDSDSVNIIEEKKIVLKKGMNEITEEISTELKRSGIYRAVYEFEEIGQGSIFFDVGDKEAPEKNHEPVLFTIGEKEAAAGLSLEFFAEGDDIDGDMLIYSAEGLPRGASFDPWTKRFFWKPGEAQAGEYFVTFIVSDGKARASERVRIIVFSGISTIPDVKAVAWPVTGAAPLEVRFSSQPANKYKKIVKYEWDFDGKGVYDFSSLESGEAIFTYMGEGVFPAVLRVTDKNGITSASPVNINVGKNPDAPGVYLKASPLKGIPPCKVFFKGGAFCPQGISRYEWDFDDDGIFEAGSSESGEVVKTYTLPGEYNAEFRVTSADGLAGSEKVLIEIGDPGVLSVKSSIAPIAGSVPVEVNFEASVNGGRPIQKYQWDFEGDGVFDYTSLSSGAAKHAYNEPGLYTPTARVTDIKNISAENKKEVRFGILNPGDIKKGHIAANLQKGKAPLVVSFSFEAEDELNDAEYLWDFDGNGAIDLVTLAPVAEFTYNDAGVYMAKLDIRAGKSVIMSCHKTIYIANGNAGAASYSARNNIKNVFKNKTEKLILSDKTSLVLAADILDEDDIVSIKRLESIHVPREINLDQNKPIGEYREYEFESRKGPFDKEMAISIPYADENEDGIVDNKNISELTLDAYWYDEDNGVWKILADSLIFPKENIVTVKTNHFTIFGIAGAENVSQPESRAQQNNDAGGNSGGGGNCFIATAVFGSPMAEEVAALREFRDQYLLKSELGEKFVNFYYHFSPPVAEFIKHKPFLKSQIQVLIKFIVIFLKFII